MPSLHERYDWFDQARGLVVLMLLSSMIVGELEGDIVMHEPFLGPTFLNHGYDYYDGMPALITLIDVGQPIFVFMLGFAATIAFTSRLDQRGGRSALFYALRRVLVLYACGLVDDALLPMAGGRDPNWSAVLHGGTFAKLALGSAAAYAALFLIRDADRRALSGVAMIAAHALLYAYPVFDHREWQDDILGLPKFPFGAVSMMAIGILGSCFSQWMRSDPQDPGAGLRRRVLPAATAALAAAYCMEWLQPSEHHDVPAALALFAIGGAGMNVLIFYGLGCAGLRLPILSALGKNLLLMFILSLFCVQMWIAQIPKEWMLVAPVFRLIVVGIAPMVMLCLIAKALERYNIVIRA
jgi:hypothetical protein